MKRFTSVILAVAAFALVVVGCNGKVEQNRFGLKESDKMVVNEELDRVRFEAYYGASVKTIENTDGGFVVVPAGAIMEVFAEPKASAKVVEVQPLKVGDVEDAEQLRDMFVPARYLTDGFLYYTIHIDTSIVAAGKIKKME